MRISFRLFLVIFACLLSVSLVAAQSGRKQKKSENQPPPQGVNQPDKRVQNNDFGGAATSSSTDPEPEEEKGKDGKPKLQANKKRLIVMSAMPDMNVSLYFADIARQGLLSEVRRLSPMLQISDSGSNQNRSDAIKAAKDSDDAYVVLLEIESMMGGGMINGLDLRFYLFEPKTGKMIGSGSGMPRRPSIGGGGSVPIGSGSRTDILMDWAARDVAQQVISRINPRPGF